MHFVCSNDSASAIPSVPGVLAPTIVALACGRTWYALEMDMIREEHDYISGAYSTSYVYHATVWSAAEAL